MEFIVESTAPEGIVKGWNIKSPSGNTLTGFKTKREAEIVADFFNSEIKDSINCRSSSTNGA